MDQTNTPNTLTQEEVERKMREIRESEKMQGFECGGKVIEFPSDGVFVVACVNGAQTLV